MVSPCTTCISLADCSRCPDFDDWLVATETPQPPPCYQCRETEWLLLGGESFDQIPGRLGVKRASLMVHLHRHGRSDLVPRPVLGVTL